MSPECSLDTTVVIAGTGLIGGALACALAQAGLRVAAADAPPADGDHIHVISPAGRRLLEATGIWAGLARDAGVIRAFRVIDGARPLLFHYEREDEGDDSPDGALGWVIEERTARRVVQRLLAASPNATVLDSARVESVYESGAGIRVVLSDGRTVAAQLAVAADGRDSPTRALAAIGVTRWDHGLSVISCVVEHELPHDGGACARLLPGGQFTSLPMVGDRSAVVWCERSKRAAEIMGRDEGSFHAELAHRFGDYLGELRVVGPRRIQPAPSHMAESCVGRRLALVGDAAHSAHPASGQATTLALTDVGALAETVIDAARLGFDVGGVSVLERFASWRRFDNTTAQLVNDGMQRLSCSGAPPIRMARNVGLALVDRIAPAKTFFMRRVLGETGALPKLMRGEAL